MPGILSEVAAGHRPHSVQHGEESDARAQMRGSAAMVRIVSDAARNRMSYTTALFWKAMSSTPAAQ